MINILIVNLICTTYPCQLVYKLKYMPIQTQQQKRKAIYSMKQDLKLISCLSQQQTQIDISNFPKKIKTVKQLSNVLSMKNRQLFFQERRYNFQKQQSRLTSRNHSRMNEFDIYSIKVSQEKDRVIEEIKKKGKQNIKQKGLEQISMNMIEGFIAASIQQNTNGSSILQYLSLFGLKQVADTYKINNEANDQNIEDLISCLKILNNQQEQHEVVEEQPQRREKIENIENHKQVFKLMLGLRTQSKHLPLISLLTNKDINSKFEFTQNFSFLLNQMNNLFKNSPYNQKKCLNQQQYFFRNIALLDDQIMLQSDRYSQPLFWQKLSNLFILGPAQYYHIEYLLNYKKQFQVLKHFKCVLDRQSSTFEESPSLMATNHHYKQFLLMLKGEYLQQCLKKDSKDAQWLLMIAIRESIFLRQRSLPRDFHLKFLKEASQQKFLSLKDLLTSDQSESSIRKEVTKLFILGQYLKVISLYCDHGKITSLQALWLCGLIAEVDYRHSTILMYQHFKISSFFKSELLRIIQQIKQSHEIQAYYLLIKILKPCWLCDSLDKSYTINLATSNKLLLEYFVQTVGCQSFLKCFQLEITDITSIIDKSVENYQDYAYCYQLTLSSVLNLEDLPTIVLKKRQQNQQTKVRSIRQARSSLVIYNIGKKYNQFEKLYLNIFQRCSQQFQQENKCKRFSIFRNGFISLIKTNLFLFQNNQLCSKKYQQISYINKIYKSLNSSLAKKKMAQQLNSQDPKQIQSHQKQIDNLVNLLVLCSNMLKIRNSIRNRQFQYLVQSYNTILEDISDNFSQTLTQLQPLFDDPSNLTEIIYTFISDIMQSLLYLRQSKPKVIKSNNRNIRRFCKQIHSFTKYINFCRGQENLLQQQLQKFIREIDA